MGERDPRDGPPPISLSALYKGIRELQLYEKLFFWGATVYTCAMFLPWVGRWNGWSLGFVATAGNLVMVGALLVQLGGLAGLGPGLTSTTWLRVYRYLGWLPGLVPIVGFAQGASEIGAPLAVLAVAVNLYALYKILEGRGLLPFRIQR